MRKAALQILEMPKNTAIVHSSKTAMARQPLEPNKPNFEYYPDLLTKEEQTELKEHLNKIPWQRVTYNKYGKKMSTPRYTFCYGTPLDMEEDKSSKEEKATTHPTVTFRKKTYQSEPIPDWLNILKERAEAKTGKKFNATILNKYQTGEDNINWHTDDEKFLAHTTVASWTIGASRPFRVRINGEVHEVSLASGSLGVLYNGVEHCVPKKKTEGIRYNITFRCLGKLEGFGNYYNYNRGSNYEN